MMRRDGTQPDRKPADDERRLSSVYSQDEDSSGAAFARFSARLLAVSMLLAFAVMGSHPAAAQMIAVPWDKAAHAGFFFAVTLVLRWAIAWPLWAVATLGMGKKLECLQSHRLFNLPSL